MANRRAIVKRRKAVRNTKKITRTMQLIATARFQAAMNRAVASRPYVNKLQEMVADLSGAASGEFVHPLMEPQSSEKRAALVILTSNRGFCGGYNVNVLRAARERMRQLAEQGYETDVTMIGTKGAKAFRFEGRKVERAIADLGDAPTFDQVEPLARQLMHQFREGEVTAVDVAYMRFHSAGRQAPELVSLLPLSRPEEQTGKRSNAQYEIHPSPEKLLDELLPATVRMRLFQSFNDAVVSEQIARMAAMKAATEAAADMIKNLSREYNRARQTQITLELLDIVGGANALA